jgi:hypothetical protein
MLKRFSFELIKKHKREKTRDKMEIKFENNQDFTRTVEIFTNY